MNVDEDGSRGSPVAKRRSLHFNFQPSFHSNKPVFGSPAFGSPSPAHTAPRRSSPRRNSPKKVSGHIFEKPTFVRSRPQARQQQLDFSSSSDTAASRMRRVASIENMVARESPFNARNAPLPNASVHPHAQPHPLSQTFGAAGEVNQLSSTNWTTPQNSYKTAKPNLLAFHSTGFVPKRGRPLGGDKEHGPQPDTPCKRTTAFPGSAFQTKNIGARIPMGDLGSPHTPVPAGSHVGTSLLNRRDSFTSTESEDPDRSQSSVEYDLPPTPTKKSWGDFDDDSVFTMNKRLRTEDNCMLYISLLDALFLITMWQSLGSGPIHGTVLEPQRTTLCLRILVVFQSLGRFIILRANGPLCHFCL
jgi:mitosis inhibitor protein kinase SWE1